MQVQSLGKNEPIKHVPVRKTTSTKSEARVITSVSTAMKLEGLKGASLASKEIELIILPGEGENPAEGEEKAEEQEKEGAAQQAAVIGIRHALPSRRKSTSSVAAKIDGIYDRVFFSNASEREILARAVAGNILSNIRRDEREAADVSRRRQEETKEKVREDIKEDTEHHDQIQEGIRSDYGVSQKKRKPNEPTSPPNPR